MEQVTEVESIEEETSISEIGTLEHLEEMHHEILKVTNAFIKGRSKERIIYLRRRFPHYFQSIRLYNAIIGNNFIQLDFLIAIFRNIQKQFGFGC